MNTQGKVNKRLFSKTELATQKVELVLELGGIKTISSKLKANIKSYRKKFDTLDVLVRDLKSEADKLDDRVYLFYKEVEKIEKEGKKQAAALGIKFSDTPIGKEVNAIDSSILSGELEIIKHGLNIKIN
tara:strand:+ start:302 stop:688 length:387 start_codon:yes stop_codon:yes gene_type:complete